MPSQRRNSQQAESRSPRSLFLALYAFFGVVLAFAVQGVVGQFSSIVQPGKNYQWNLADAVLMGSILSIVPTIVVFFTTNSGRKIARPLTSSLVNSLVVVVFAFVIAWPLLPGNQSDQIIYFAAAILGVAGTVGLGTANFEWAKKGLPQSKEARRLEHERLIGLLDQLSLIVSGVAVFATFEFFKGLLDELSGPLRLSSSRPAALAVLGVHIIAAVILLVGMAYVLLVPVYRRIIRIENREGKSAK